MKRAIIMWWISRAIDQSQDVSGWLRSQIERDPELQRFERAARRLENDLRKDSLAWIGDEPFRMDSKVAPRARRVVQSTRRKTSRRLALSLITVAAVFFLIGGSLIWKGTHDDHPSPGSTSGVMELTSSSAQRTSPPDAKALAEIIEASHALIQPFATTLPQRLRASTLSSADIRDTYHSFVTVPTAEHAWKDIKSTIHKERQHVTTDLRSAVTFISQRLPRSAARLLGLEFL